MPRPPGPKDSLDLPPGAAQPPRRDSGEDSGGSSSSSTSHNPSSTSTYTDQTVSGQVSAEASAISHFSLSAVLQELRGSQSGPAPAEAATADKLKGERARTLLRMLLRNPKTSEESAPPSAVTDIHNLIPCGDVAGLLAVNVKQCKDFTPKFVVKRDTYLLVRISIDKIMKCTNPQIYRAGASVKNNKKINAVNFGDMKYFSVKVPMQRSDPRNRITLELVGFEGPKDFPRLFGNVSVHLYEVIQKQTFTEVFAMRIRNMVFCTAEVEFMFCYGCFGYGYSHQLKLPGADPAKAVAYSMFLRVPPPENRKDLSRQIFFISNR
ncbi:cation channel sperm-associated targeting subunit tau [Pogona vitticeps]